MALDRNTLVLMSEQPVFDTLALEVGRGLVVDLTKPSDYLVKTLGQKNMASPQHVDEEVMDLLVRDHGERLDDELAKDAAEMTPALPPTGALPIIEPSEVKTATEVAEEPVAERPTIAKVLNENRKPRPPRTPRQSRPGKGSATS